MTTPQNTTPPPSIAVISRDGNRTRYRLVGQPEPAGAAEGWAVREGREPWCEITVYGDGFVGSFGGELWPGAWPSLFKIGPRTTRGQHTYATDRFRALAAEVTP